MYGQQWMFLKDNCSIIDEEGGIIEEPIKNDIQVIHDFTNDLRLVDATQKLKYDMNGIIVFNFGKYNGQPVVDVLSKDKQYYHWIIDKEFSAQVKQTVKQLMKDYEKSKKG
jgi:DNA polymerase III subunit epsilon